MAPASPEARGSLLGRITNVIFGSLVFRSVRNMTAEAALKMLRDDKENQAIPDIPHDKLGSKPCIFTKESLGNPDGKIGEHWDVYHMRQERGQPSRKVMIWFHGGGFFLKAFKAHWLTVQDWAFDCLDADVVCADYTLAPFATASQVIPMAISLIVQVSQDPRYSGKEICLNGESAGGWIAMRLALALTDLALGAKPGYDIGIAPPTCPWDLTELIQARNSLTSIVLISPCVDLILDLPEDDRAAEREILLSPEATRVAANAWMYGIQNSQPGFDCHLPVNSRCFDEPAATSKIPGTASFFMLLNGLDVLDRYHNSELGHGQKPLRIFQAIGANDWLSESNKRFQTGWIGSRRRKIRVSSGFFWLHEAKDLRSKLQAFGHV